MRRLLLLVAATILLGAAPAAASPTVRLAIVHYVRGCHVWSAKTILGPSTQITIPRGTKLTIRVSCPMDFQLSQTAGPSVDLGNGRTPAGTTRTIVFRRPGTYKLVATNLQTSAEVGLQTLGEDNTLLLTVRVK